MSLHKLTAGSGYDYLTRQVAAHGRHRQGPHRARLLLHREGRGPRRLGRLRAWPASTGCEPATSSPPSRCRPCSAPGTTRWPRSAPRADLRIGRPGLTRPTEADYQAAARLGAPYKVYAGDVSAFRIEVAKRLAECNADEPGMPGDWPVPAAERARIRTEVAREFFRAEHGRDPADARELAATIAKHSRPKHHRGRRVRPDLLPRQERLDPVGDRRPDRPPPLIERAHHAAVKDALDFLETHALFTRAGRQRGPAGRRPRPGRHRVHPPRLPRRRPRPAHPRRGREQGPDPRRPAGKWLAIDGRLLFKADVVGLGDLQHRPGAAPDATPSGCASPSVPTPTPRKRPVREIVGVDPRLNERFSKRRASIEDRRTVLVAAFQATHGRPPTPVETLQLAQQATLETREAKHEPRSLAEQRDTWHREAVEVLGTPERVAQMVARALNPGRTTTLSPRAAGTSRPTRGGCGLGRATADRIVATMEGGRSTWQYWHVYAEAQRQVRAANVATDQVVDVVDLLVDEVLTAGSVALTRPADEPPGSSNRPSCAAPTAPRSTPGRLRPLHLARFWPPKQRLVDGAGRHDGYAAEASSVDLALLESAANGITLNAGQATLVREMATSGARLQLAIAPAGSGKTTAMRALASAWTDGGGTVIGLAPSAAAADALRSHIGTQTDTLAKLTHSIDRARLSEAGLAMRRRTGSPASTPRPWW